MTDISSVFSLRMEADIVMKRRGREEEGNEKIEEKEGE